MRRVHEREFYCCWLCVGLALGLYRELRRVTMSSRRVVFLRLPPLLALYVVYRGILTSRMNVTWRSGVTLALCVIVT